MGKVFKEHAFSKRYDFQKNRDVYSLLAGKSVFAKVANIQNLIPTSKKGPTGEYYKKNLT